MKKFFLILILSGGFLFAREVIYLDGTWDIAEGSYSKMPEVFTSKIPVPSFADMATPAFEDVGALIELKDRTLIRKVADPKREAFWYKRTVNIDKDIPATAQIKIFKAAYTSELYVNGQRVGGNSASFTPKTYDVKKFLKKGVNTVVIKVGASLAQIPPHYSIGSDFEKERYLPGIYDSVTLTLSGENFIEEAQIAPDLERGGIKVRGLLSNYNPSRIFSYHPAYNKEIAGQELSEALSKKVASKFAKEIKPPTPLQGDIVDIKLTVKERKSGKVVATSQIKSPEVFWYSSEYFETFIEMPDFKLWSPETPFLYVLEIETPTDNFSTRFGMRSFKGDDQKGVFLLNNKPYYMRGTNICFFRFSEDPVRGNLPWDYDWVRKLHKTFKDAHWNSIRYCIGFPPEKWYEIADEEGFLIQDEFPIWTGGRTYQTDVEPEVLAVEYLAWMKEHVNYPCVVIWDAQNESVDMPAIYKAVMQVRDYDLSKRPWDFGWGLQMRRGDSSERHPYRAVKVRKHDYSRNAYNFPQDLDRPDGPIAAIPPCGGIGTSFNKPCIINEYDWLWLNRDGSTTTLTDVVYEYICGKDVSAEYRRNLAARYIALLTEYWRITRDYAGVLHFCSLSYSRSNGQTSDNFIDVKNLIYEPKFKEYVFESFTPICAFIRYFEKPLKAGVKENFTVEIINDEDKTFDAQVSFEIRTLEGEIIGAYKKDSQIDALGKSVLQFEVDLPEKAGKYDIWACVYKKNASERYTRSVRYLNIIE